MHKMRWILPLLLVLMLLTGCNLFGEQVSAEYRDYAEMEKAEMVEKGWVPPFIPASARNIRLLYNVDTNAVMLGFGFETSDQEAMTSACTPATADTIVEPTMEADWWPNNLISRKDVALYRCPDGGALAVIEASGYYWANVQPLTVAALHQHPKRYARFDGDRIPVFGYVDFDNLLPREVGQEHDRMGLVREGGQMAESALFVEFDPLVDATPLFDCLTSLRESYEEKGLPILVTGTLQLYDQPTNFSTGVGYALEVVRLADATPMGVSCTMPSPSILGQLGDADYPLADAGGVAHLQDGFFEEEIIPGSATMLHVSLDEPVAVGDVDGDGLQDAVVLLRVDESGSGLFTYLSIVLNRDGQPQPLEAIFLGDRIRVEVVKVEADGTVVVQYLDRHPTDAFADPPTVAVERRFRLGNGGVVELMP